MKSRMFALFLAGFLAGAGPALAFQDQPRGQGQSRSLQPSPVKPLDTILDIIGEQVPGRALDARLVEGDSDPDYRIKWLDKRGRVHDILTDATTGQILEIR